MHAVVSLLLSLAPVVAQEADDAPPTLLEERTAEEQAKREAEQAARTAPAADPDNAAAPVLDLTASPEEVVEEEPEYITVLVINRAVVKEARDRLVRGMEALGWKSRRKDDGRIVFVGPRGWMGKAILRPTGDMDWTLPAIALDGPRDVGGRYDADELLQNNPQMGTVGLATTPFPGKKKVRAAQAAVRAEIEPLLLDYQRKSQQAWFGDYVAALPERLDALWSEGRALGADAVLQGMDARRAAVLDFWSTRADTPEGRTVSRTVEIWLRETVQPTEHAITEAEAQAAEAARGDGRRLDLF